MKSKWFTVLAGVVTAVVAASVAIGLASPDGSVGDGPSAASRPSSAATPAPSATPTATPAPSATTTTPEEPSADLAPASLSEPWPGRPDAAVLTGSRVDWCPAVTTTGAAEAEREFGKKSVDSAACAAVRFVLEQRYSRLSLPRRSYDAKDFDAVTAALSGSTAQTYRPRINRFIASPNDPDAAEDLGLVLLRGAGTVASGQLSAGGGRVFYGKAFTTKGYRDRAVWVNPAWSRVTVRLDRSKAEPRLAVSLTASAAVPVFEPSERRDDMLTIPTTATMFLRQEGSAWRVSGWTQLASGPWSYAPLRLK